MKEPNFDRYGFAYQSILSRKDFFNETCLKGITKIYMEFSRFHDGYFKNAVAILRMVNRRRNKNHKEPLKFIFQNTEPDRHKAVSEIYKRLVPNLLFDRWGSISSLNIDGGSQNVFIHIFDSKNQDWECRRVLKKGGCCYRLASVPEIRDQKSVV